jgi:hypothetical protein
VTHEEVQAADKAMHERTMTPKDKADLEAMKNAK